MFEQFNAQIRSSFRKESNSVLAQKSAIVICISKISISPLHAMYSLLYGSFVCLSNARPNLLD